MKHSSPSTGQPESHSPTMNSSMKNSVIHLFAIASFAILSICQSTQAATQTWQGTAGSGDWATDANWTAGPAPVNGDSLIFTSANAFGSNTLTNTLATSLTLANITFNVGSPAYTMTGNSFQLQNGSNITNNSSNLQTFSNTGGLVATGANNSVFDFSMASGTNIAVNQFSSNITGSYFIRANGVGKTLTLGGLAITVPATSARVANITGSANVTITGPVTNGNSSANVLNYGGTGILQLIDTNSSFTGAMRVSSGTLSVANIANSGVNSAIGAGSTIQLGSDLAGNLGTLQYTGISGGSSNRTININNGASGGSGAIENTVAGQTLTLSGNVTTSASASASGLTLQGTGNGVLSGNITGTPALSLTKSGAGIWTVSGSNTYTGTTSVSAGTLLVSNTAGSGLGTGAVTVSGGVLGGTGAFTGAVTVNASGTLAPGASIQSLASGALTLNNNSTFAFELDFAAPLSASADLQIVSGALNLNGTVSLTLSNLNVGTFANGTTFSLINYTGAWNSGLFTYNSDALTDDSTFSFNGQMWQINYNATTGGSNFVPDQIGGNFVNITVVPEPSTYALLLGCVGVLILLRRRGGAAV